MLESLATISIIGLMVGFIFSVPVAGPISILITSHALKGEGRYCVRVAFGTIVWFYYFSKFLIRNRQKLTVHVLNRMVQILGVVLCFLGAYMIHIAIRMFRGLSIGSFPGA